MLNRLMHRFVAKRPEACGRHKEPAKPEVRRQKDEKRKLDKFAVWLEQNPNGTFEQFYAESAVRSLTSGKAHSSLGSALKPGREERAREIVDGWLRWGIRSSDTVVDYGCGTLRTGRLLIEFLDADRYIGLDIDDRILAAGQNSLPADLLSLKRPRLEVISADSLRRAAARQPKWVCSKGVLQHVPPTELDRFFSNLSQFVLIGATGLIGGRVWETRQRLSSVTFGHTLEDLQASASRSGMALERLGSSYGTLLVLSPTK